MKRPWGEFKTFAMNEKCSVKILEIKPQGQLSLQKHKKRKEIWYFLESGVVQLGNKKKKVNSGEMVTVLKNQLHRIIAGRKKVRVLEISFGRFDEKDEVRLEDKYGRG